MFLYQMRITGYNPIYLSLDFQFHKRQDELVKNNNVVITLENQRGDAVKFFSSPIGGVPVYQGKIGIEKVKPKK